MTELGLAIGWALMAAILAVPCFTFVAQPVGRRYALPFRTRMLMAFALAGVWSALVMVNPGSFTPEADCIEQTPQGSGHC